MVKLLIRDARLPQDEAGLWAILEPVVREGLTYPVDPAASRQEVMAYWLAPDKKVYVAEELAEEAGGMVGTYYLKPNSTGPAAHVANAGYMVHPAARGRGVARAMASDSFARANAQGFAAMQFNLVVASNAAAVHLWRSVGMHEIGRLPGAFRLPDGVMADALVMYRMLEGCE
ncbi:MAG TPA: N-acetyltransferase [Paracoccaceae bacterium]|nr:N-acetyltransferase [Paracoccaceae bacterium]